MNKSLINKVRNDLLKLKLYSLGDWDPAKKEYAEAYIPPTIIERDGLLLVSAEDGNYFVDYYGEYRGGYPYIHPKIEAVAKKHGAYWEWENPGAISLAE